MSCPSISAVCQRCALCCDGTLFTSVPLTDQEVIELALSPVTVESRAGQGPVLRQPCEGLEKTRCSLYQSRPRPCREYECLLVAALRSKEISESEALETVSEARRREQRLDDLIPPAPEGTWATQRARREALSEEARRALTASEEFLTRYFLGRSAHSGR